MIYNSEMSRLLMCKRSKNPYKGLSNLVGGKIEPGETGIMAAYRELQEETGITDQDVVLHHLMDFVYHVHGCYLEVYVGKLRRDVQVSGNEHELYWADLDQNFFDLSRFAGEGNIGHMIEQVNLVRDKLFSETACSSQYVITY